MTDAHVVGAGIIDFGEKYDWSFEDLLEGAYLDLVESVDYGVDPTNDIDGVWYAHAGHRKRGVVRCRSRTRDGLFETPATQIVNACATGSDAFRNAVQAIKAEDIDVALVIGAEKMLDSTEGLIGGAALERLWRGRGVTMPAFFGMRATRHMDQYDTTREQIAAVSVKNHENGTKYPHAHQQFECSVDDVKESPTVSYPLNLYDCCPVTDGACAVLVASDDRAREFTDAPVRVAGYGLSTDSFQRGDDLALTNFPASRHASSTAYERSGYGPDDIDVAEVHDCFSITELITYEDLGFCEQGEGGSHIDEGIPTWTENSRSIPPAACCRKGIRSATGVAQIAEIFEQLRGEAGDVQVPDAEVGMQHNIGIGRNAPVPSPV